MVIFRAQTWTLTKFPKMFRRDSSKIFLIIFTCLKLKRKVFFAKSMMDTTSSPPQLFKNVLCVIFLLISLSYIIRPRRICAHRHFKDCSQLQVQLYHSLHFSIPIISFTNSFLHFQPLQHTNFPLFPSSASHSREQTNTGLQEQRDQQGRKESSLKLLKHTLR